MTKKAKKADPKRGEPAPQGGIWVGRSPNNIAWIAYQASDFGPMCQAFDDLMRWCHAVDKAKA